MVAAAVPTRLHPVDLTLIAVYLVGITLFGLRFRSGKDRNARSLRSYFLADQAIPWWAIALSIVSAETSTLTIISIPGLAFAGDFGFLQIVIGYMLGRIVVALIFLPKYFQGKMLTAYQLIDQRFGHTLHKVTAGLFLLTRAAAEGVRVFAVSIVVGIAIGTGDVLSIGIISALTLLYTFEGGMAAVIWTDVVQMAIYIGGTFVAIYTLGAHVPGGWSQIHQVAAAAGKFHLFHFAFNLTQSYTFWAGVLGGTFLTMASHGTDQLMVQRMLAARNLRESRLALLSSGGVIFLQFTLFLLIGAGLYVFYGLHPMVFASADRIFPTFIVREMPVGVAGLLVAAILAAAMSNLSAALNSLSSTTVVDFYMHWRPEADERERMMISRSSTVVWAVVLFAVAVYSVFAGGKGHVVEVGLSIASVAYGALLGVFLLGTLTRYATQAGAIVGMICGFALNLLLWLDPNPIVLGPVTIPHVAFTWYVLIGSIVTFGVGTMASLLLPRGKRQEKAAAQVVGLVLALAIPFLLTTHGESQESASSTASVRADSNGQYDFSSITTLMDQAVAAKKLPGGVVLVNHDGKRVFEKAYGVRKYTGELSGPSGDRAEPMTADTIFDMASLTKCLATATAVMQLVEKGKVDVDAPVTKYLPEFGVNGKDVVTVRELLTHYSGLPPDVDLKDTWGLAGPEKSDGIRRAMSAKLDNVPGTKFVYSDINFITLGAIVEKVSGETLDVYAERHIFGPLKMTHTRYLPVERACGPDEAINYPIVNDRLVFHDVATDATVPCRKGDWVAKEWAWNAAPTQHDDQGTKETNPDFDHLLRGTVHDPTTRRMGGVAGHAGVFSTAEDIGIFAQALLDRLAGRPSDFPLKRETLRLMTQPEQPAMAAGGATIFMQEGKTTTGVAARGFGWDINTAFSRPRGEVFPIGSFGHTGFTGTSLWMDPNSDTFVVILANSVHPRGASPISSLRGAVATAATRALHLYEKGPAVANGETLTGIDVLEATQFSALHEAAGRHGGHLRLGVMTNQTGVDRGGRRTVDVLLHSIPEVEVKTLFSPEHGLLGVKDTTKIGAEVDAATHLPVASLYGAKDEQRRPSMEALKNLDAVVIDLQDAGVRFYTYQTVVGYFLEAAAKAHIEIIVLDRPNPIGGVAVQGPVSDNGAESYSDYMPLPIREGMTLGELALYFNGERLLASATSSNVRVPIRAQLTVVAMRNWSRTQYFDDTGLKWIDPSPNLRSAAANVVYPGVELLQSTNVSVGRGTEMPFLHIGAPYIDSAQLAAYLTARKIPGVSFAPASFSVTEDANRFPFHGKTLPGISFTVTDKSALDSPELGIELISALHHLYPEFAMAKAEHLIANADTMRALENQEDPRKIAEGWKADLADFEQRRQGYLLYK